MPLAPTPICAPNITSVLRAVVGVIDMSDPEHESFADSAADCLDELLRHDAQIRALLAAAIAAQAVAESHEAALQIELERLEYHTRTSGAPRHVPITPVPAAVLDQFSERREQILSAQAEDEDARPLVIGKRDPENGLDFWNNEDGFGRLADATVFTPAQAAEFDLPIADDEPEWLTMPIIR